MKARVFSAFAAFITEIVARKGLGVACERHLE
jgi:hypothetical protein